MKFIKLELKKGKKDDVSVVTVREGQLQQGEFQIGYAEINIGSEAPVIKRPASPKKTNR